MCVSVRWGVCACVCVCVCVCVQITQDLKHERKLAFRGMLLSALASIGILPKEKRDNFLANYRLCPPPLFIPIITLIQVEFGNPF